MKYISKKESVFKAIGQNTTGAILSGALWARRSIFHAAKSSRMPYGHFYFVSLSNPISQIHHGKFFVIGQFEGRSPS